MNLLPESLFEKFGKVYEAGQIVFCEYEPGNDFYLFRKAALKSQRPSAMRRRLSMY